MIQINTTNQRNVMNPFINNDWQMNNTIITK